MKHLLLVHGVNNNHDDHNFKTYVFHQLAPHIQNFDVVVLNSHESNIYKMIEASIDNGEKNIRITPLTCFTTFEQLEVLPEVITTFNHTHPWVTITVAQPFYQHKHLKSILELQLPIDVSDKDLVAFIGLGHVSLNVPNDELSQFTAIFDDQSFNVKGFMLNGVMDYQALLPNMMRRYERLVVVPLYFMHEKVHGEMCQNLKTLVPDKRIYVLPSLSTSDALKKMVIDEIQEIEGNRIYIND